MLSIEIESFFNIAKINDIIRVILAKWHLFNIKRLKKQLYQYVLPKKTQKNKKKVYNIFCL